MSNDPLQPSQNLVPGSFREPQDTHTTGRAAAHSPQNLLPSPFSQPQAEQRIRPITSDLTSVRSIGQNAV